MPPAKYAVYWTITAQKDLEDIIDFIAEETPGRAKTIFRKIKKQSRQLTRFPFRGRVVPELRFHHVESYREIVVKPWRIIYRIDGDRVYVLAVFDGRRNLEDILLERILKE